MNGYDDEQRTPGPPAYAAAVCLECHRREPVNLDAWLREGEQFTCHDQLMFIETDRATADAAVERALEAGAEPHQITARLSTGIGPRAPIPLVPPSAHRQIELNETLERAFSPERDDPAIHQDVHHGLQPDPEPPKPRLDLTAIAAAWSNDRWTVEIGHSEHNVLPRSVPGLALEIRIIAPTANRTVAIAVDPDAPQDPVSQLTAQINAHVEAFLDELRQGPWGR